jgi:hypothetical protein
LKISQEPGRRATFQANKTIDVCGKRHSHKRLHCCGTTVLSHIISEVGVAGGIYDPVKMRKQTAGKTLVAIADAAHFRIVYNTAVKLHGFTPNFSPSQCAFIPHGPFGEQWHSVPSRIASNQAEQSASERNMRSVGL